MLFVCTKTLILGRPNINNITSGDDNDEDGVYSSLINNLKMGNVVPKRSSTKKRPSVSSIKFLTDGINSENREIHV